MTQKRKRSITTVSSKGQITIPAAIMRELSIKPGDKLAVVPMSIGVMLVPESETAVDRLAGSLESVHGDAMEYVERERSSWD